MEAKLTTDQWVSQGTGDLQRSPSEGNKSFQGPSESGQPVGSKRSTKYVPLKEWKAYRIETKVIIQPSRKQTIYKDVPLMGRKGFKVSQKAGDLQIMFLWRNEKLKGSKQKWSFNQLGSRWAPKDVSLKEWKAYRVESKVIIQPAREQVISKRCLSEGMKSLQGRIKSDHSTS